MTKPIIRKIILLVNEIDSFECEGRTFFIHPTIEYDVKVKNRKPYTVADAKTGASALFIDEPDTMWAEMRLTDLLSDPKRRKKFFDNVEGLQVIND